MRLKGTKAPKPAKNIRLPPVIDFTPLYAGLQSVIMSAYASTFQEFDEYSVMKFFEKVGEFLSHLLSDYPSFSFETVFREVLRLISQVCPTQQMLFKTYLEMSGPSIEDALQYLSTVQMCSKEQRTYLKLYRHELVAHHEFVTVMTDILDVQDRLIQVLLARIQNAITV
jgi:hypothetical protein